MPTSKPEWTRTSREGGALRHAFSWLARKATHVTGSAWGFGVAALVVLAWAVTGPLFGFSDTWQLVINTGTTIVTFLMVFLIQHSQNRDTQALQLKLNELLAATEGASNRLVDVEDLSEEELHVLQRYYQRLADRVREGMAPEKRAVDGEPPATHERKGRTPTDHAMRGRRAG